MRRNQTLCFGEVHRFLDSLFDGDLHAKRILSLTNATLGVIKTASLAVNTIGQGLALARGDQACDQAAGSAAVQRGNRYRRRTAPLGSLRGGMPRLH
jgi:hypothetical protein